MSSRLVPFSHTYDETLDMIVEARNYVAYASPRQRARGKDGTDLKFCCEALRVTSRLTQVMAWLMMQRAAVVGEISIEEAMREDNRLSGHGVCLDTSSTDDQSLPEGLRSLLSRSYQLYRRVARLEDMVLSRTSFRESALS